MRVNWVIFTTSYDGPSVLHTSEIVKDTFREQSTTAVVWNICFVDTFLLGNMHKIAYNIIEEVNIIEVHSAFLASAFPEKCSFLEISFVFRCVRPIMGGLSFFIPSLFFWPGKNLSGKSSRCSLLAGKVLDSFLAGRIEQNIFSQKLAQYSSIFNPIHQH